MMAASVGIRAFKDGTFVAEIQYPHGTPYMASERLPSALQALLEALKMASACNEEFVKRGLSVQFPGLEELEELAREGLS